MNLEALKAEFPREAISWRAQSVTKDGTKAMALAYIDARDVMNRLDEVCGPGKWQDEYVETAKGRIICRIGIKLWDGPPNDWTWKSDGAGNTDVEGDKGAISDAFKRCAVKWGIGRYLYDMPAPWVPCETFNGKWKKWTADPWKYVKAPQKAPTVALPHDLEPSLPPFVANCRDQHGGGEGFAQYVAETFAAQWKRCKTQTSMENSLEKHKPSLDWLERESLEGYRQVIDAYENHLMKINNNFTREAAE